MKSPLSLEVSDLACSRGERRLFGNLSFSIAAGEAMVVTGPNGAGKTTLLRAMAGFIRADSGHVRLQGASDDEALPENLHFVGHRDGLKGALTVRENLALAPELLDCGGVPIETAAERLALLSLLDLPVAVLSAGQRRRVALARLLVAARPIWLLDEPTAALDSASQEIVAGLLAEHVAAGGIVVAATHLALGIQARELAFDVGGGFTVGASRP